MEAAVEDFLDRLQHVDTSPQAIDDLVRQLNALEKSVNDALPYIPPYDQQQYAKVACIVESLVVT